MPLNKFITATSCGCLILTSTSALRLCTSFTPLNNLLVEACGIAIFTNGLCFAFTFHNSSAAPIGSVVASQEYKNLLEPVLVRSLGQEPRKKVLWCPESRSRSKSSPFDESVLDFLTAAFLWPQQPWRPSTEEMLAELPPLQPAAQLIRDEIPTLHSFRNPTRKSLLRLAIGVEMPSWLMATKEACHIASAK